MKKARNMRTYTTLKKAIVVALLLLTVFMLCACTAADVCVRVEEEELTDEAKAAFSALSGERGVMLYSDPAQMTGSKVRMYAVLYGSSGQELSLSHSFFNLVWKITGQPQEGYTVWRIEYNPRWVRRASFQQNGEEQAMDGYEELKFTVEESLRAQE